MITADVSQSLRVFRKAYTDLTGREFDQQVARALNHTARKSKTRVSIEIRAKYKIKARDIKASIHITNANVNRLSAFVTASGKALPLRAFPHRQTKQGVTVNIMHKRRLINKAFIATMKSGHKGVFARGQYKKGGFKFRNKRVNNTAFNDLPINELFTTSVPSAMGRNEILNRLANQIHEDFPVRLAHLLGRASSFGASKYI